MHPDTPPISDPDPQQRVGVPPVQLDPQQQADIANAQRHVQDVLTRAQVPALYEELVNSLIEVAHLRRQLAELRGAAEVSDGPLDPDPT